MTPPVMTVRTVHHPAAEAPVGGAARAPALRALSLYSIAIYGGQALVVLRGLILAKVLAPEGFGLWRIVKLLLGYVQHLPLGNVHALRQELPQALGAGQGARAQAITRTLFGANLLIGLGATILCLAAALVMPHLWPAVPGWIWLLLALLAPAQLLFEFMVTKLNAEERVGPFSGLLLAVGLMTVVAMPLGAVVAGVVGALVGLAVSYVAALAWLAAWGELPRASRPQWAALKPLWAVGLPIWVVWLPVHALGDLDQWLVAWWLGPSAVGLYGIATFFGSLLTFLPHVHRTAFQPSLRRQLGQSGSSRTLQMPLVQSLLLMAYGCPLVIAALMILVEPLVRLWLPAYQAGLAAARVYFLLHFWHLSASVTFTFCLAAGHTRVWLRQTLLALAGHAVLTSVVIRAGAGLVGAAACTGAVYLCYAAAQVRLAMRLAQAPAPAWLSLLGRLAIPFVACGVVTGAVLRWPVPEDISGLIGVTGCRLLVALPLLWLILRAANHRWGFTEVLQMPTGQVSGTAVGLEEPELP